MFGMRGSDSRLGAIESSSLEGVILATVHTEISFDELDSLAPGVALPLHDAIQACRARPPVGWPVKAYELVGRTDLALIDMIASYGHETVSSKNCANIKPLSRAYARPTGIRDFVHYEGVGRSSSEQIQDEDGR